jgi:hypothetical protein
MQSRLRSKLYLSHCQRNLGSWILNSERVRPRLPSGCPIGLRVWVTPGNLSRDTPQRWQLPKLPASGTKPRSAAYGRLASQYTPGNFFFLAGHSKELYNLREAQGLPLAAYFKLVALPWHSLLRSNTSLRFKPFLLLLHLTLVPSSTVNGSLLAVNFYDFRH